MNRGVREGRPYNILCKEDKKVDNTEITGRLEQPADYRAVEELTRDAFWGYTGPACDEHYLVHIQRKLPSYMPELCFVAEVGGELAGSIVYTKSKIAGADGGETDVITFGPVSVLLRNLQIRLGNYN
ncbi:MAG: hypothetical protein FWE91_00300 [Defluviitaleaceae bacterium]|nr:hypothetical protein [Defluviitaleaceae bacterium]MCL2836279.1 hypothetical protein [Defluviitaleaceae bacterium]